MTSDKPLLPLLGSFVEYLHVLLNKNGMAVNKIKWRYLLGLNKQDITS